MSAAVGNALALVCVAMACVGLLLSGIAAMRRARVRREQFELLRELRTSAATRPERSAS
jgi:hypothetical protein